jgi:hypothetical protein
MSSRVLRVAMVLMAASASLRAQADTARRPFFTWRDAAMIEAFAIATVAAAPLDRRFAERLQTPSVQENRALENAAVFVETVTDPGSYLIGISLYTYGRLAGKRRLADLGLHGTEAIFLGNALGYTLKGVFGRARPRLNIEDPHNYSAFRGFRAGGDYQAFPSGHAIAAFSAAATVTSEAKRWRRGSEWFVGPIMYGGAATVAWSRMFQNRHWATDVLTGAAIGTFVGLKVVHYHHFWNVDNVLDRKLLALKVSPGAEGSTLVGLTLTY